MNQKMPGDSKKRMFIIAGVLVVFSLLIVILSEQRKNSQSISEDYMGSVDMMFTEESPTVDNTMTLMQKSAVASDMMIDESRTRITPDQGLTNDTVPHADTNRHIIKNGNLTLRVPSLDDAVKNITSVAKQYSGDVVSADFSTTRRNVQNGFLTVKVPVDRFDQVMQDIKALASLVENESLSTNDVTEQVIDLNATLTNKKAQEERLRAFFERADSVKDLLAVEKELTTVRGEIERLEARLKSLTNRTSFSTITIHITEDTQIAPPEDGWRPGQVAKESINSLIKKGQALIDSVIAITISKLPFFFLSLMSLWIVYMVGKKVIVTISRRMEK